MSLANMSLSKSISKKAPEVLPRTSRARRFGIDCESELRWHAKEPGGDYKQKLLIKNVSNQVLHVPLCCCLSLRMLVITVHGLLGWFFFRAAHRQVCEDRKRCRTEGKSNAI